MEQPLQDATTHDASPAIADSVDTSHIQDDSEIARDDSILPDQVEQTDQAEPAEASTSVDPTDPAVDAAVTPTTARKKPKYAPKDKTILSDASTRKAKQQLTPLDRAFIAGAAWAGAKPVEIAKHMRCGETTVRATLHKYKERGTFEDIPRPGRPKICDDDVEKRILLMLKEDPELTYNQLKTKAGVTVSNATLRRVIKRHGLGAKIRIPHDPTAPMVPYPRWKVDSAKLKKIVGEAPMPDTQGGAPSGHSTLGQNQAPLANMQPAQIATHQSSEHYAAGGLQQMHAMQVQYEHGQPNHHLQHHLEHDQQHTHPDQDMEDADDHDIDPELSGGHHILMGGRRADSDAEGHAADEGGGHGMHGNWRLEDRTDPSLITLAQQLQEFAGQLPVGGN